MPNAGGPRPAPTERGRKESLSLIRPASEDPLAAAVLVLAQAIDRHGEKTKPIADFFEGAGERLDKLCQFIRSKGPLFLWLAPVVIVLVQSISPNAAEALDTVLKAIAAAGQGN